MNDHPQKVTDDVAKALERCAESLSISEFSRVTGVRIELLRRFVNHQVNNIRAETWDKIYPHLKPFLVDPKEQPRVPRIGPTYRRHNELVGMVSDQKVLLDVFNVLSTPKRQEALSLMCENNRASASKYRSLNADENKLMGAYLALPPEEQDRRLRLLLTLGKEEIRRTRRELAG